MDWFDLIPLVPPGLPGERSQDRTLAQQLVAGTASVLLPTINLVLVLFASFAVHPTIGRPSAVTVASDSRHIPTSRSATCAPVSRRSGVWMRSRCAPAAA